jgi:virginiamycin A acetyltransferase
MIFRRIIKKAVQGLFLIFVFPSALLCAFGRIEVLYTFFAQLFALFPGIVGAFLRSAFYKYTLRECSLDTAISFGTFFSNREARVEANVSIGSFCVIGRARIGMRTQISSHVEIPSGRYQHRRDEQGRFLDSESAEVVIGSDCWIGASAVIMANVGDQSTIGAGSVVTKDIPDRVIAVGVPAKPMKNSGDS